MRLALLIVFAVFAYAAPVGAVAQVSGKPPSAAQKERDAQRARAIARCKAERGVDCETPGGLKEWLLQERSRAQAEREGSRRRTPVQPVK